VCAPASIATRRYTRKTASFLQNLLPLCMATCLHLTPKKNVATGLVLLNLLPSLALHSFQHSSNGLVPMNLLPSSEPHSLSWPCSHELAAVERNALNFTSQEVSFIVFCICHLRHMSSTHPSAVIKHDRYRRSDRNRFTANATPIPISEAATRSVPTCCTASMMQ
jgi:hypothetical protein